MKSIEENITTGFEYQRGHPAEEKRGECPVFKDIDHFWGALKSTNESELPQISWAPAIPSAEQIQMALHEFHAFLQRYDNFTK